jgi:membrane-anchored glycerophosphoryl diester phosphodiesterase (GDPDase)
VDAVIAIVFIGGVFALGYWIGAMRTKLKFTMPTMDMKKYQKLKKALDESFQKAQSLQQQNQN